MRTSLLGISLNRPLMSWGLIEINLLLFVPILGLARVNKTPSIMRIKYFFIQSLASVALLVRIIFIINISWGVIKISSLLRFSLMWKLGAPPFHLWLFNIMIDLDWLLFFIISTWQKILPFYILRQIILELVDFFIIFSLLIPVRGALFQTRIKKILIISSIFIGAWVVASIIFIKTWWLYIFLFYRIILFFCVLVFFNNKITALEGNNFYIINTQEKFTLFFLLLSIAGFPPFLGFFIKLLILLILLQHLKIVISLLIVLASVVIIYIYLRIFFRFLLIQNISSKNSFLFKISDYFMLILFIYILRPTLLFMW